MIRTLILAAIATLLRAQSPPVVATTATQPEGGAGGCPQCTVTLTIRNLAGSTLTAYALKGVGWSVRPDGGKGGTVVFVGYKDAAVELGIAPILPSQQAVLTFLNGEVTFMAALWADGSSYGDPEWVNHLRERRALAQLHNDNALALLRQAFDSRSGTPEVIKQLQAAMDSITPTNVRGEDIGILRGYYQIAVRRFANPDGFAKSIVDGSPVHMTDREIIRESIQDLKQRQDRMQQYR